MCESYGGGTLSALAEALDLRPADLLGATWEQLDDLLGPPVRSDSRRSATVGLPPAWRFEEWAERLRSRAGRRALRYLTHERGVALDVIERHGVGLNGSRLTFPMRRAGRIVAAKWRYPRPGAQMRSWPGGGRDWPLYPEPEPEWSWALIVAGEFDALRGRSTGLPASSVTVGAGTWRDAWTDDIRHCRGVAVCFDNGEQAQARERVRELREAGINAVGLDLRTLGLDAAKGDLSDYLSGGGSPHAIRRALRRARTAA